MKHKLLLLITVASSLVAQAQLKQGTVTFERKQNMHRTIQNEEIKAMVPEYRTSKHVLVFSDSESVYKVVPEDETPDPFNGGGGGVFIRVGGADGGIIYKNFAASKSVEERELGAKTYIIADSIRGQKWKLTNETKQIMGFNCRKATTTTEMRRAVMRTISNNGTSTEDTARPAPTTQAITAWYADDITCPVGPENYGGLPGVILQIDIDNGLIVFNAIDIKQTANEKEVKEPKKGKKVTRDEFNKLMMDAFGGQGGGGGQRIMRFGN
jgi:GLPGLI family protein